MALFSIVPIEVCADNRLSKMQIRVLIALLSFRAKNTDTVWPSRKLLSERCGYTATTISRVTSQLVDLGWLEKDGKGGFSKACRYRITVPEPKTVSESKTVSEPVTRGVSEPVTITVSEPVTRKEQTIEHTKEQTISRDDPFEAFWRSYPRKTGKGAARKSWSKIKPSASLFRQIMSALEDQKHSTQWLRDSGKYIPHPATWLNQERWDDQPDAAQIEVRRFVP